MSNYVTETPGELRDRRHPPQRGESEAEFEHEAEPPISSLDDASRESQSTQWPDAVEYASRLNRLFNTVGSTSLSPFTNEEVAESLQADGIPVHADSIARLRGGTGPPPPQRTSYALSFFFNVEPDYLVAGLDFREDASPKLTPAMPEALSRPARAAPVAAEEPTNFHASPAQADADLKLSTTDLLRVVAGLSGAAQYAAQRVYADRVLVRRLAMLISDAAPLLTESLNGDVRVPIRFLEHVIFAWDETSPEDNGTEPDYRWLAELLNRHLG